MKQIVVRIEHDKKTIKKQILKHFDISIDNNKIYEYDDMMNFFYK
jgi:hypothetical protein